MCRGTRGCRGALPARRQRRRRNREPLGPLHTGWSLHQHHLNNTQGHVDVIVEHRGVNKEDSNADSWLLGRVIISHVRYSILHTAQSSGCT